MFCQTIKGQKISLFSQGTNVNYYHEKELPFTNCNRNRKFSLSCGGLPRVPVNNNNNKPKSTSRTQWKYNVLLHWMVPWSTSLKESKQKIMRTEWLTLWYFHQIPSVLTELCFCTFQLFSWMIPNCETLYAEIQLWNGKHKEEFHITLPLKLNIFFLGLF